MSKPPHKDRGPRPAAPPTANQVSVHAQWEGPLPHPAALERFNAIIPNGADRITTMAEKEQAHRIEHEHLGLEATIAEARRGQICGAALSGLAMVGAVVAAWIGAHWAVSIALLSVPVMSVVRALIRPRQ